MRTIKEAGRQPFAIPAQLEHGQEQIHFIDPRLRCSYVIIDDRFAPCEFLAAWNIPYGRSLASKGDDGMARIKNLNAAIAKEPETAGVEIQRKNPRGKDAGQAPASPKTTGAPTRGSGPSADPFPSRQSDARPVAGKTPRPTNNPGE